jgi:hypothetical protein
MNMMLNTMHFRTSDNSGFFFNGQLYSLEQKTIGENLHYCDCLGVNSITIENFDPVLARTLTKEELKQYLKEFQTTENLYNFTHALISHCMGYDSDNDLVNSNRTKILGYLDLSTQGQGNNVRAEHFFQGFTVICFTAEDRLFVGIKIFEDLTSFNEFLTTEKIKL